MLYNFLDLVKSLQHFEPFRDNSYTKKEVSWEEVGQRTGEQTGVQGDAVWSEGRGVKGQTTNEGDFRDEKNVDQVRMSGDGV